MAKRKKSKPVIEAAADQRQDMPTADDQAPKAEQADDAQENSSATVATPNRTSWYGGSWRAKATPVAQIAKESIFVTKGATSESSESPASRPPNSVSKSIRGGSRKSVPLAAEATRVHATSDVGDKSRPRFPSEEKLKGIDGGSEAKVVVEEAQLPPEPVVAEAVGDKDSKEEAQPTGNWLGWWSRPDGYGSEQDKKAKRQKIDLEEASGTPLPGTPVFGPVDVAEGQKDVEDPDTKLRPEKSANPASSKGWFGLWSSAQNQQAQVATDDKVAAGSRDVPEVTVSAEPPNVEETVAATSKAPTSEKHDTEERPKSSGWAFWSSDRSKDPAPTPGGTQKQVGELAVADTPSQSHPEVAQFNEQQESRDENAAKAAQKRTGSLLKPQRGRTEKVTDAVAGSSTPITPAITPSPSPAPTPSDTLSQEDSDAHRPAKKGKAAQIASNWVLPSFKETYSLAPNPGYIERLTSYLAQSLHLPGSEPGPLPRHVFKSTQDPVIKKAVALGVHGFFPAPLIQKVLGQPTGTSIRFANHAANAIKTWCEEHQPKGPRVEIEKVALEGEGYIADRVTTLWKLLLNWLSHLRSADFILVACHSQGVPVATMLVAKLIQLGCLGPHVRIGICAMAGINLGPFAEYKSRLFGGTALELFDFGDSKSKVSQAYTESLDVCLRAGVRITYVGSLDDQLVSLESSLYTPLSHPYVTRAVFVDGRLHAPNFLTHLVVFALKLRNRGLSDHGLLRELSAPLAGSLVGGEGHSRVYDDAAVYALATEFALQTTDAPLPDLSAADEAREAAAAASRRRPSLSGIPSSTALANRVRRGSLSASSAAALPGVAPHISAYEPAANSTTANPFVLPFAVRGVLEEELVKRDEGLRKEVVALVKEFDEWKPSSKVMKDIRWRLEGVRFL